MKIMKMPGFTAENAVFTYSTRKRVVPALLPGDSDTPMDRRLDCFLDCRESGQSAAECSKRCDRSLGVPVTPPTAASSASYPPDWLCTIEQITHPIGAALIHAGISNLRESGAIKTKEECYGATKVPAVVIGAAAGASAAESGPFGSALIGALAGFNIETLGQCICNSYFS